jgi:16S rRNA (guanine966-N2)-methyltransferase
MRVIAGTYRSRTLRTLRGLQLRPTSDRLRETLFNILRPGVKGSVFVDAFAGSGAVGIEALSRGADEVFFIENHAPAAAMIRKNLDSLGVPVGTHAIGGSRVEIFSTDALRGLETLVKRHVAADFVYLDPPYQARDDYDEVLEFLGAPHLLASEGLVVVEHLVRDLAPPTGHLGPLTGLPQWTLPDQISGLERVRVVEQGDSALSFYRLARAA